MFLGGQVLQVFAAGVAQPVVHSAYPPPPRPPHPFTNADELLLTPGGVLKQMLLDRAEDAAW